MTTKTQEIKIEFEQTGGPAPTDVLQEIHESVKLVNRLYSSVPHLDYDDVINRGLLLVKSEPTYCEMAEAFVYVVANELDAGDLKNWDVDGFAQDTERMRNWWDKSEPYRSEFLRRLDDLSKDPQKSRRKHQDADTSILHESLLGVVDFSKEGDWFPRFFPMTIEAAYTYVLLLLYNGKHNRWKRLAKCEWCGSYFLKKRGSGRPRKYCTDDCTEKADQKLHAPTRQGTDNQREKERNRRRRNREEGKK